MTQIQRNAVRLLAASAAISLGAWGQTTSVLATGLQLPYKLALTPQGNLLVTEAGGPPNSGRVSLVQRSGGTRTTLLQGLPSGPSNPDGTPIGPTGIALRERVLYLAISEGDGVRNGATPGSLVLNPAGVSSPLFASVLRVRFDTDPDLILSPFTLARAQHSELADGAEVALTNADGAKASVDLLAHYPALSTDPATVYRHHDPFALALDPARPDTLYLVESGQNALLRINTQTGRSKVLTRFAPLPNPTQVGPPVMDAVPTAALVLGDQVVVTMLSGFPFVPGYGNARVYDLVTGKTDPWINGLNTAIDIGMRKAASGAAEYFVLGFSSNMGTTPPGPGQLWKYDSPTGKVVVDDLVTPTGMAIDPASGDIYITELGAGQIRRVRLP
jgi:hypothetical protein